MPVTMSSASLSGGTDIVRVVLLGVLRNGPMHGYAIKQTLQEWRMDFWADVKPGSIYGGLKRLVADGLVEEVGVSRSGNRPVRTTFALTNDGRAELRRLLRTCWTLPSRVARPVDLALQFAQELPAAEIEPLLEERMQALENRIVLFSPPLRPVFDDPARQARVDDLFEHELLVLRAELEWCKHVRKRLQSGAYGSVAKPRRAGRPA